jgi:hypothetical protein
MKEPLCITDERRADRILSIVVFGGFLSVALWALTTQMNPVTVTAVVFYYGLIATVSLLLSIVLWRNLLFRMYTIDEAAFMEITSFGKMLEWRKCYSHQDVSSIEIESCRCGFPVSHAWYDERFHLANGKYRILVTSRDKQKTDTLIAQINEVWSKK